MPSIWMPSTALPEVEEAAGQGDTPRQHSVDPAHEQALLAPFGDSGRDAQGVEPVMLHQLAERWNRHRVDVPYGMTVGGIPTVHTDDLFARDFHIAELIPQQQRQPVLPACQVGQRDHCIASRA